MALVGNLRDIKLPNLIQLNCMERNTAKLTIDYSGKYGFIYFQGGQVVHAEYDPDIGDKAFYRMLQLSEGKFKVESGIRPPVVSIETHWNNLLLEGLHQLDSTNSDGNRDEDKLLNMLMNVKGVINCAIISKEGKIISSELPLHGDEITAAFAFLQVDKAVNLFDKQEGVFVSLLEQSKRVLLSGIKENIVYIALDPKHQLELVLPFIKKALF